MYPKYDLEPIGLDATRAKIKEEVCHFIQNAGGEVPNGAPCFGANPNGGPGTSPTTTTGVITTPSTVNGTVTVHTASTNVSTPKPSDQTTKGATGRSYFSTKLDEVHECSVITQFLQL